MRAEDIINYTDPEEVRNILYRLRRQVDVIQLPPPFELVNDLPSSYPSTSTSAGNGLDWFNVKDYGAVGDGVTDDTISVSNAIAALTTAGRGVLYFPPGTYLTSGGFTLSVPFLVLGMGQDKYLPDTSHYVSRILCNSASAVLFDVTAIKGGFRDISLANTAGSTPSAGAGIKVSSSNSGQRINYENVSVSSFYINIDIQVGEYWYMNGCWLQSPVLYAVKIRNTVNDDAGDWYLSRCTFGGGIYNSDAAIRIESSGGGKIVNCKINGDGITFNHGIDLASSASGTGIFIVSSCSIENVRGHGIKLSGNPWHSIILNAIQFGLSWNTGNNTGNAINISGSFSYITIMGCVFTGGSTPVAISLTSVLHCRIVGNINNTFSALVSTSGVTNVVVIEPGSSVVTETDFGQSPAAGTSGYYARQDHTHGTPSLSNATPEPVGAVGDAGVGLTASRYDHVHEGGTNSSGEILMADGVTSPPVPLETEDGSDWLYEG